MKRFDPIALRVVGGVLIAIGVWGGLVFGFYQVARQPLKTYPDPAVAAAYERTLGQAAAAFFGVLATLTALVGAVFYRAKRTQKALRQAEWLHRQLAEISADIILKFDPDGTVQFVSPKVRIYGYRPEEVIGKPATTFLPPEDHEPFKRRLAALKRGEAVPAAAFRVKTADGRIAYGECRSFGVYEGNRLQAIWCTFHDLTDLLRLNRELLEKADALAQANADWELTYDTIGTGIAILDDTFTIVRANRALGELLGCPLDRLVGQKCWSALHPNAEGMSCPFEAALRQGQWVMQELSLPDGRIFVVRAYPSFKGKTLRRVIHTLRDVTQERQAQQLLEQTQRLVTLGQMAAGVAHEINNPLNAIVGMAELLLENLSEETHRPMVRMIYEQALRIGRITRNLLTFARPRPQELVPIDLNRLVQEVIGLVAYRLRSANISVQLQLRDPLPSVMGDATQLQQVLLNLINNAHDAMANQGGGQLTIRTGVDGAMVRLWVDDTGPGIPSEYLPHLFDPFFTTKTVGKGAGLGLTIAYGIVTGHGGRIRAENRPEGGARFIVELPVAPCETTPAISASQAPSRSSPQEPPMPMQILVVEDEMPLATTLQALLVREGHQVTLVNDGDAAINALAQRDYDLILCDLKMPKVNGEQVYEWLQANKPHLRGRFVLMTGDFLHPAVQRASEEWGVPILHKPFRVDELRALIKERAQTIKGAS